MYYKKLIDELLQELSYRVGIPDLKNKEHQSIISEILTEWGEFGAKEIIMDFITEAGKTPDMNKPKADTEGEDKDYAHIGRGFYVRKGDVGNDGKSKPGAQKYKNNNGQMQAISDTEYEKLKTQQGQDGEKAAANTTQNQQGGGENTTDDVETQKGIEKTLGPNSEYGKEQKKLKDKVDAENQEDDKETPKSTKQKNIENSIKVSEELKSNLDFIIENRDTTRLKTGGGSNSPSVQDVKDLQKFTEERMNQDKRRLEAESRGEEFTEEPYVHPSITQREISDETLDAVFDYLKANLPEKEYDALIRKFANGGAVPAHLTRLRKLKKGEEGYPGFDKTTPGFIRAKEIIRLYLKNDGKSPVTGKPLPLSHMEPDHRLPFTTAEEDLVNSNQFPGLSLKTKKPADGNSLQEIMKKTKDELSDYDKKVISALEPLQAKYDDPKTNMDLLSGPVNQFKGSLINDKLLNSIRKKLAENPGEKQLENEYKTERKRLLGEHHLKNVENGWVPPYNEYNIVNADIVETNEMMKSHNYFHPDAATITQYTKGNPSKGIEPDPNYYDKVKAFWKNKGVILPENVEDVDFKKPPFNQTMTIYVQAGRARGGAKRRGLTEDHDYMIEKFKEFGYFGNSLEDDKTQQEAIDKSREEINRKIDDKRIAWLRVQLENPELTGKKRDNRQSELDFLLKKYNM